MRIYDFADKNRLVLAINRKPGGGFISYFHNAEFRGDQDRHFGAAVGEGKTAYDAVKDLVNKIRGALMRSKSTDGIYVPDYLKLPETI